MDVPLIVATRLSPVPQAEVMFTPGAKISTHVPQFVNQALWSRLSLAATVMAPGTREGEKVQASQLAFPAATTYVNPAAIELVIASSRACVALPLRLILTTAGFIPWRVTQSTPAITPEVVPLPAQSSTRTPCRLTPLATPNV